MGGAFTLAFIMVVAAIVVVAWPLLPFASKKVGDHFKDQDKKDDERDGRQL